MTKQDSIGISGLLVSYGTLKHMMKTKGKLNIPILYLHRYLRLTPVYAFLLLILCTLFLHILDGPYTNVAETSGPLLKNCYENWWTNIIYINNFVPDRRSGQCMGWTWYLANDMQFFLVSPLFLIALYKNRKIGYALLTASLLSCMLANGIMGDKYEIPVGAVSTLEPFSEETSKYTDYLYRRPYYRIAPYIIGLAVGDILANIKDKSKIKIPIVANLILWVLAIGLNLIMFYSLFPLYRDRRQFEPSIGGLYLATSKTAWAVTLGYIVFACVTGNGGPVNWFLSWRIWQPVARLSYGAYLIHPMVIYWYYCNRQQLIHANDYNMIYLYLGNMSLSFTAAFAASLLVEAPFMRLENILLRR